MNVSRFGNKGVTSRVRADDEMPILENGKRVDILFNTLGVINRLNSQQIFEQSITFITSRTIEKMDELVNANKADEALELMVKIVNYFNETESVELEKFIGELDELDRVQFANEIMDNGINIHIPPMLWEKSLYDIIKTIYKENPWIQPYDVYIKKFGRYIRMVNKLYVGSMYIMKLKQSAKKGLSVRSTGHISHRGLPEKTKRSHRELYSKTPIRIGGDENNNMNIGVDSEIINMLHTYYRSSVHGRQMLAQTLGTKIENVDMEDLEDPIISNRNVEILNAYNKILGIKMVFEEPDKTMRLVDTKNNKLHQLDDGTFIMGSDEDCLKANIRIKVIDKLNKKTKGIEFMSMEEYNDFVEREVERIYNL